MKTEYVVDHFDRLSPRELQILRLYSRGKNGKEIAGTLGIRYHTVGTYKKRIMDKLSLKNHNHFLVAAVQHSFFPNGLDGKDGRDGKFAARGPAGKLSPQRKRRKA